MVTEIMLSLAWILRARPRVGKPHILSERCKRCAPVMSTFLSGRSYSFRPFPDISFVEMSTCDAMVSIDISAISHIPWCADLLSDPSFSLMRTKSRTSKPDTEDSFFGSTLATNSTISACVTQWRHPSQIANQYELPYPAIREVRTFLSFGDGVNGYPHVAHGGFAATLLDEVMGILLSANKDFEEKRLRSRDDDNPTQTRRRFHTVTASVRLAYRKPIPTPSTVLVRAWFDRVDGKKNFILGTIEDGTGNVYTCGSALFVRVGEKL